MKQITLLFLIVFHLQSFAIDRIVEEFGFPPAYSSIGAAVAAANDGDRIIIKNRAGNIPWIEHITINKSLQFLSHANDDFFVVQGNYTIEPIDGLDIAIIGMRNTGGNILQGSGTAPNRSAKVSIMDAWLQAGEIILTNNAFDVQVIGNKINSGRIHIAIGNIIGNEVYGQNVGSSLVSVSNPNSIFLGDTCMIIGNKIHLITSVYNHYALEISNNQQVVHILNNYIRFSAVGIYISNGINNPIINQVRNNTFRGETSFLPNTSSQYGIRVFNTPTNSIWEVMNNAFIRGNIYSTNRIALSASSVNGQANAYYNHMSSGWTQYVSGAWTFSDLNPAGQTIEIDQENGQLLNAPNAINGGNPAPQFYDLDLTPNDAGAYGGSFTLNNFFPQHTGAARIYNVIYPFNVRAGNTMNIKAYSYDR